MIVRKIYGLELLGSLSTADLRVLYQQTLARIDPRRRKPISAIKLEKQGLPR